MGRQVKTGMSSQPAPVSVVPRPPPAISIPGWTPPAPVVMPPPPPPTQPRYTLKMEYQDGRLVDFLIIIC